ncbi:MAG: hypothetical protein V1678_03310 [Candidatus Aenigmatarchaeota archaeon]
MKKTKSYENFPLRIVLLSNLVSTAIYLIGLYVFLQLGVFFAFLYLVYILLMEFRLLKKSCRNCYYYGKTCAFGRGRCCALFFRKGSPKEFLKKEVTMKDILPDFLVFILPLIGGIILLLFGFSWSIVILLIVLLALSFGGSGFIRGSCACRYCKQREIGCPAERMFRKKK